MAIFKSKNGTWRVVFRDVHKRGFKTKFDAQQFESRVRLQSEDVSVSIKFHVVANDFLEYKRTRVSHGTYTRLKNYVQKRIIPNTKNKHISRITRLDVRQFDDYVRSLDLSTTTKRAIIADYKAVFKHSELFYNNSNNPTNTLELVKYTDEELIAREEKKKNIWSIEEFQKFNDQLNDDDYKLLFNILFFTGMRLGEALALQHKDFRDGLISITKSITAKAANGTYAVTTPKNQSSIREIESGDYLSKLIEDQYLLHKTTKGFKLTWFIIGGKEPMAQTHIRRVKAAAVKKAKIKMIRTHDLRHSHASNLISQSVPITAVSNRLGHSNVAMTLEVYTHLLPKDNTVLLDAINSFEMKIK